MNGVRPAFSSSVASPEELLERVRKRLAVDTPPEPAPRSTPEFDLSLPDGLGVGWFDAEVVDGHLTRWTAREFEFEAWAQDATHLLLEAALFAESGHRELRARTRFNETSGPSFRIHPGWHRYWIGIPAGLKGRVECAIDVGGSWCPHATGHAPDARELGVLVRRLAVVPFLEVPAAPEPPRTFRTRVLRRLRRFLLGSEFENRLRWMESRLEELECRARLLAEADAEGLVSASEAERALRMEIERGIHLRRG